MNKYWKRKVEIAAEIAYENGFGAYNLEFWKTQSAGVISLLLKMSNREVHLCDKCYNSIGDWDGVCECVNRSEKVAGESDSVRFMNHLDRIAGLLGIDWTDGDFPLEECLDAIKMESML